MRRSLFIAGVIALCACEREERRFRELPAGATPNEAISQSELTPGANTLPADLSGPYEGNAWAVNEGKKLFDAYNCSGCHAHGAGGMGPALIDDQWIYGSAPANIFATIVEGRPNGMPSFRNKIPNAQVWQLVAYVRSMSGMVRQDVLPGRNDGMAEQPPESMKEPESPKPAPGKTP